MARKHVVRIRAAPKVGNVYWCSLHPEEVVHIPEFWKKRPVIVVSRNASLHGKVTVLPMTTDDDNQKNAFAIELADETCRKIDGKRTWVVCDHLMTVATSRLDNMAKTPPRIAGKELTGILRMAHAVLAGWPPSLAGHLRHRFLTMARSRELTRRRIFGRHDASAGPQGRRLSARRLRSQATLPGGFGRSGIEKRTAADDPANRRKA